MTASRRRRRVAVLGASATCLLAPAPAAADTLHFGGRSGAHRHVTCVADVGCRPYRISGTVSANIYGRGPRDYVADAALGIFYSTAALGPDTLLVYGFEYRRRGGPWNRACVRGRCLFDSRKRASWPGNRFGDQYFRVRLPIISPRRIAEFRLRVVPLTETGSGRWVGRRHTHTFKVRYRTCVCPLPSGNRDPDAPLEPEAETGPEPAPEPEAQPEPDPAPAPAPAPAPRPPARDVCAGHPSDPSVVCTRNAGHTVDVCDRDPDGHRAYARVITEESSPAFLSPFYDDNDSRAGCANLHFPSRVLSVAVCVQYEGCSPFKET